MPPSTTPKSRRLDELHSKKGYQTWAFKARSSFSRRDTLHVIEEQTPPSTTKDKTLTALEFSTAQRAYQDDLGQQRHRDSLIAEVVAQNQLNGQRTDEANAAQMDAHDKYVVNFRKKHWSVDIHVDFADLLAEPGDYKDPFYAMFAFDSETGQVLSGDDAELYNATDHTRFVHLKYVVPADAQPNERGYHTVHVRKSDTNDRYQAQDQQQDNLGPNPRDNEYPDEADETFLSSMGPPLRNVPIQVPVSEAAPVAPERTRPETEWEFAERQQAFVEHSKEIYEDVVDCCKGDALKVLQGVIEHDGVAAWNALEKQFHVKGTQTRLALLRELFDLKQAPNQTIVSFHLKWKELLRKVDVHDMKWDDVVIMLFLMSLHDGFKPFVQNATMNDQIGDLDSLTEKALAFGQHYHISDEASQTGTALGAEVSTEDCPHGKDCRKHQAGKCGKKHPRDGGRGRGRGQKNQRGNGRGQGGRNENSKKRSQTLTPGAWICSKSGTYNKPGRTECYKHGCNGTRPLSKQDRADSVETAYAALVAETAALKKSLKKERKAYSQPRSKKTSRRKVDSDSDSDSGEESMAVEVVSNGNLAHAAVSSLSTKPVESVSLSDSSSNVQAVTTTEGVSQPMLTLQDQALMMSMLENKQISDIFHIDSTTTADSATAVDKLAADLVEAASAAEVVSPRQKSTKRSRRRLKHALGVSATGEVRMKVDSGASLHFVSTNLPVGNKRTADVTCKVANGDTLHVSKRAKFSGNISGTKMDFDVHRDKHFDMDLFSVQQAVADGHSVRFGPDGSFMKLDDGTRIPFETTRNGWNLVFDSIAGQSR